MDITILETGAIETLTLIDVNTGANYINDFVSNADGFGASENDISGKIVKVENITKGYVYSKGDIQVFFDNFDDDSYVTSQENYDWWKAVTDDEHDVQSLVFKAKQIGVSDADIQAALDQDKNPNDLAGRTNTKLWAIGKAVEKQEDVLFEAAEKAKEKHTVSSVRAEGQALTTKCFEKYGVFFAYSKKQFDDGVLKIKLDAGEKVVNVISGAYCKSSVADDFIAELEAIFEQNKKDMLEKVGVETIIKYELENHESYYTGSIDSACDALADLDITDRALISKIYWQELPNHEDCY